MKECVLVDIETTDLEEYIGAIVEVGAVKLDLQNGKITKLIDSIVLEDRFDPIKDKKAWVFEKTNLTPEIVVEKGESWEKIKKELEKILLKYPATAYNKQFDFKFLISRGIKIPVQLPCPMLTLTPILQLPFNYQSRTGFKWPSFQESWDYFYPDSDYKEIHRAYDDVYHEATLFHLIYTKGIIKINGE